MRNYEKPNSFSSYVLREELAMQYVQKIKKIKSKVPYYISGWSLGGIISIRNGKAIGSH